MQTNFEGRDNRLLQALPADDYARLVSMLQRVRIERGQVVCEQDSELQYVYFPITAVMSLQCALADGSTCEVTGIGAEGLIGASLFMYDSMAPNRALVQTGGWTYRGGAHRLAVEFSRGGAFQRLILRYVQTLFMELTQSSICNRRHSVEQRLSRWLLGTLDRGEARELAATHEWLGEILGVRRESITAAARTLQNCGAIRCRRGRLTVLDHRELEQRSCECYGVVRALHSRLLNAGAAPPRPVREARPAHEPRPLLGVARAQCDRYTQPLSIGADAPPGYGLNIATLPTLHR
ncbi:MAG: Crp/Fnr family transcriptional regulator [Steroidobacteraceae bacterium]